MNADGGTFVRRIQLNVRKNRRGNPDKKKPRPGNGGGGGVCGTKELPLRGYFHLGKEQGIGKKKASKEKESRGRGTSTVYMQPNPKV